MPCCDVPLHLRNVPTQLMNNVDDGTDYRYANNEEGAYAVGENYFPEAITDTVYYYPIELGLETKIKDKLTYLRSFDAASTQQRYTKQ